MLTPLMNSGASQSRMETFQLAPPLLSQLTPSLKQISNCGALSGMVENVIENELLLARVITALVQSVLLVEK